MKTCKDCTKEKNESEFYGIQGECKECTKARVRVNYRKNIAHYIAYEQQRSQRPDRKAKAIIYQQRRRARHPGKNRARQKVNNAIRDGKLFRKPCQVCDDLKTEAHHTDYRRPLVVQWLCRKHHLEAEGKSAYKK